MDIRNILWASDGSKESRAALEWAELLAARFGARVTALSVIETPDFRTLKVPQDLRRELSVVDAEMERAESRRLKRITAALAEKGVVAEACVAKGFPYAEILKAAQRNVDLIAMGKRGLNLWGRMLLGSTTMRVVREARVPVLTVKAAAGKPSLGKIVVPTSFCENDVTALAWALTVARKFHATVTLLHVIEAHRSYDSVEGGIMGRLRSAANQELAALRERIPRSQRKGIALVERVIAFPRAWSGIVTFVGEQGADLIVMSTHARAGVSRLVLGSVAEGVVREAPCPVVTVRP
ncbi:MAG TPA: universal stress protein [candidate division Zixibacteria bacterium]|nr:universal stress protein [candidate division Zixibacteria bacterium]